VFGEKLFFPLLDGKIVPTKKSLQVLTGEMIGDAPTPMIQRANTAWVTPLSDLSCEQVRLLVSQTMGLRYLAEPVAIFVQNDPYAWVTFYPGDLSVAALKAFPELLEISPVAARKMASVDFDQVIQGLEKVDPAFARKVKQYVQEALALARGHS
jgi:hypothetical protein